jgi:hypothetical protein
VQQLCRNIEWRVDEVDRQMNAPSRELKFNDKGFAAITDWKPRNAVSGAQYNRVTGPDDKSYLQIVGDGASSSASWRTRVMLPGGRYRFEGYVRTKGAAEHGTVAVLRISGARDIQAIQADAKWEKGVYEFEVPEAVADVELICEIRPAAGDVWFDLSSLRIVQLSNN